MARAKGSGSSKGRKEKTLTEELATLLEKTFIPDLTERAQQPKVSAALRHLYESEKSLARTATPFNDWVEHTVEQVGAAWILSCVFVRTLEDRGLLDRRRLGGEGALDSQQQFFEVAPSLTERDYVLTVLRELASFPGAADVLGPAHNPAWRLSPSNDCVRLLLALLREQSGTGLRFSFQGSDTRFLGDLYQDLSQSVRKRYALLQTPAFIEQFILDQTLEPAVVEFGLEQLKVLDPTCGSGHFLISAFQRLFEHRMRTKPGDDRRDNATRAIAQIHGVDLNPYAVAIARFRLTLAYLTCAEIDKLALAPRIEIKLVVADALLHASVGQKRLSEATSDPDAWGDRAFRLDEPGLARSLLTPSYQVVVGNPPYGPVSDRSLKDLYREKYASAAGKYVLSAPFTELFLRLSAPNGFVGFINGSTFSNKAYGRPLIEKVLPEFDIEQVISTSGVYFHPPGFGVSTVIILGRGRAYRGITTLVRHCGLDPDEYTDPGLGIVWRTIVEHAGTPGYADEYIEVLRQEEREVFRYPWRLSGGPGSEMAERLEAAEGRLLRDYCDGDGVGTVGMSNADDVFLVDADYWLREQRPTWFRMHLTGEAVRDYVRSADEAIFWPYDEQLQLRALEPEVEHWLWPQRAVLNARATFDGGTYGSDPRRQWYQWHQITKPRISCTTRVLFPEILIETCFVNDDAQASAAQSLMAFVPSKALADDAVLALVTFLNSSCVAAWIKRRCAPVGTAAGDVSKRKGRAELTRYRVPANMAHRLPVPDFVLDGPSSKRLASLGRSLMQTGRSRETLSRELTERLRKGECTDEVFGTHWAKDSDLRDLAMVLQEEVDWTVLGALFGLGTPEPPLASVLASRAGSHARPAFAEDECGWVELSAEVRQAWLARATAIRAHEAVRDVEAALFKRSWTGRRGVFGRHARTNSDTESKLLASALRSAVRTAFGEARYLSLPALLSWVESSSVAGPLLVALAERKNVSADEALRGALLAKAVPFLANSVLNDDGLAKMRSWEALWDRERRRSTDGPDSTQLTRFTRGDFLDDLYWRLRGEWNVQREEYILCAVAASEAHELFGWAGWNHLERATALAALYQDCKEKEGWDSSLLAPLLAGILELVPWIIQWHNEPDSDGQRMGEAYVAFVSEKGRELGLTLEDLRAWRPAQKRRGQAENAGMADSADDASQGRHRTAAVDPDGQPAEVAPRSRKRRPRKSAGATESE